MDQIKEFLTRRNIITLIILAVLAVGLLVSIRLVQRQTQLKSKAAEGYACNTSIGEFKYCMWFSAADGGVITAGKELVVWVVGGQDDQSPRLEGTVNFTAASSSGPGSNCNQSDFKNCWKFVIPNITSQTYTETFASEISDAANSPGRVASSFTPEAALSPSPTTVTIGGKVTRSDTGAGIPNVVMNQNATKPPDCNIGIAITNSSGDYRFTLDKDKQFCLRPPQDSSHNPIAPISAVIAPAIPDSYENLKATTDKTDFDFVYNPAAPPAPVPSNQATCESITIDGRDLGPTTQTVNPGSRHAIEIIMRNPPSDSKNTSKSWESGYSLKFTSGTLVANALGLDPTSVPLTAKVEPQKTFESGSSITITPPSTTISGAYNFVWQMHDGSGTGFGGECIRQITVGSVGGPGESPAPGGDLFSLSAGGTVFVKPGSSATHEVSVFKNRNEGGNPQIKVTIIGTHPQGMIIDPTGFSITAVYPTANQSANTKTLLISAPANAPTSTTTFSVIGEFGAEKHSDTFDVIVTGAATGGFDFSISNPSGCSTGSTDPCFNLTQGQEGQTKSFTVNRIAGDPQDVNLSVTGDIGGATFTLNPEICKPEDNNKCVSFLTFNTSQANSVTPGNYFPRIEGKAGGITKRSNSFLLKINPPAATVTCFVVSTSGNTRNLFKNCNQVTNLNNPLGGVIAGFLDSSSQTFDFTLPSGDGSKTLFARFIKVAAGQDIDPLTDCGSGSTKCKDTTAGITLNIPAPSPSPSPSPAAPSCTEFTIPGLSLTEQKNGGPVYTVPAAGDNKLVKIVFAPSSAQASFTVINPLGAPPLNINPGASNSFIADIPPNISTTQDNTYTIQAVVSSGGQQASCFPVTVIVTKAAADTSCPADISSTQVKFRKADGTGSWLAEKTIVLEESVKVAGFHNNQTPDPPPADINLSVSGPKGFSDTLSANNVTFTPRNDVGAGAYVFTATTTGKTGAKCIGTATLVVTAAPSPSPSPSPRPPVTACICQTDNSCSSPCQFTKLTDIEYTDPISCFTPTRIHNVVPDSQNKNSYCNRPRRTEGDANADGKIDIDDYLYYLTAVSGGKVPVSVNPDFDGNGDVGPNDLTIWERSRP